MGLREQLTNGVTTTLAGSLSAGATSAVFASVSSLPSTGQYRVRIDDELLLVTAGTTTTRPVSRGVESTTATSHVNGAAVVQILTAGAITAITSVYDRGAIALELDGRGSDLAVGVARRGVVPYDIEIDEAILIADSAGSLEVDLWYGSLGAYPPGSADSICGSAHLVLAGSAAVRDATLTGWTKSLTAGYALLANVVSCTGITEAMVHLGGSRA